MAQEGRRGLRYVGPQVSKPENGVSVRRGKEGLTSRQVLFHKPFAQIQDD